MKEIVSFIQKNPVVYVATCDQNHHPRVRPFMFAMAKENHLYFCTSKKKAVHDQLQQFPYVEVAISAPDYKWLRISAKVTFIDDRHIKSEILETNSVMRDIYQRVDNPDYAVFTLGEGTAGIYNLSGNPPQEFTL